MKGAIAEVRLNRPHSLNTLSARMLKELAAIALDLKKDPHIRIIILTGSSGIFSAGIDLKDPEVNKLRSGSLKERRELVVLGPEACDVWEQSPAITIAAIDGYCIGGGVSLAISCDFRIMGRSSYMSIPEINLGLNYSWGSIPRLVHLIGPARAKRMILLCEKIPASRCYEWGLADEVVPDGSVMDAAESLAAQVLEKAPIPVNMTKRAINKTVSALDQASVFMDSDQFLLTTYSDDHQEGINAFLSKRPPRFKGE
jgi:enoyl-CoA hydratase/carnithine racemase